LDVVGGPSRFPHLCCRPCGRCCAAGCDMEQDGEEGDVVGAAAAGKQPSRPCARRRPS
jgi:hypothetical protein